jgi:hypothetical protein
MIKELTKTLIPSTAINTSYRTFQGTFERLEWRNSNLPDIHQRLISYFKSYCTTLQDTEKLKDISRQVLQLEMKPATWRKLQFSFIALFPFNQW